MIKRRPIVAILCSAILVWMSVVAGLLSNGQKNEEHADSAVASILIGPQEGIHSHAGHETAHHGAAQDHTPENPVAVCVATCIELISDKIVTGVASNDFQPKQAAVAISYAEHNFAPTMMHGRLLAYWPTGPPGHRWLSESGGARLVALNARLRI